MDQEPIQYYRCPKDCSVNDYGGRCKRCGEWMLSCGKKTWEEIEKESEEISRSAY